MVRKIDMGGKTITEREMLEVFWRGGLQLPPLFFRPVALSEIGPTRAVGKDAGAISVPPRKVDAWARVVWGEREYLFAIKFTSRATPKRFREAVSPLLQEKGNRTGGQAILVVPYLTERQICELERLDMSGIDLCGNGVVVVPGELLVFRTGAPNRYRGSSRLRNVYRRNSSVVARALLVRAQYSEVNEIWREIRSRGAKIALSTVSKVLKELEEDLIVARDGGIIRVLQPEELLDKVAQNYAPPKIGLCFSGRYSRGRDEMVTLLSGAAQKLGARLVLSGTSSVSRYAVMAREDNLVFYCTRLPSLREEIGPLVSEGVRFNNVEILETEDQFVYYDTRGEQGWPWASPIQTYVELMQGDKRDQETAQQVKETILRESEASRGGG